MRLNKYISDHGLCSRREADHLISEGRVTINGAVAGMGTQTRLEDEVCIDGEVVRPQLRGGKTVKIYIALNKPLGITCTTEQAVDGNIVDLIDHPQRIFPIGRLDKNSEGLILLTSDGDVVNRILRAENHLEKEYLVVVDKPVTTDFLRKMGAGVFIHRTRTRPCQISRVNKFMFRIILIEGMNRQIRLMCASFDFHVRELCRVRIGNVRLDHLRSGQWRNLTPAELRGLIPS